MSQFPDVTLCFQECTSSIRTIQMIRKNELSLPNIMKCIWGLAGFTELQRYLSLPPTFISYRSKHFTNCILWTLEWQMYVHSHNVLNSNGLIIVIICPSPLFSSSEVQNVDLRDYLVSIIFPLNQLFSSINSKRNSKLALISLSMLCERLSKS